MKNFQIKFIPFGMLCFCVVKSFLVTNTINEVLIIALLAALTGFYEARLESKKVKELHCKINELEQKSDIHQKLIEEVRTSVTSVKIAGGIKGMTR